MGLRNRDFREMYGEQMIEFIRELRVEDLSGIKVPAEANPVKGERSRVSGHKGGKPPVDYSAVEILVDLRSALHDGDFRSAYSMYITLKRLTNA